MEIPDDLRQHMEILGESPEQFSDILKSRGQEFFISFLRCRVERREETITLYREWAPRLRAYGVDCRARNGCPDSATLSEQDRAKLPIYEDKIMNAERVRPKDGTGVIICSIPLIGILVARQLWPGEDNLSVILTPEELQGWRNIYKHPEEAHSWWVDYWWNIEDQPDPDSVVYRNRDLRVADGESPWLVTSGLSWGPLAGGATTELWSWNGREARFVRNVAVVKF